jgi:hypothetical protein
MSKQNITRFLQSFVAVPLLAVSMPLAGVASTPTISPNTAVLSSHTTVVADAITTQQAQTDAQHAQILDEYLTAHDSPLAGHGARFVAEAEKNGIDWRLLVAIAGRESSFGKHPCKSVKNSFLGYGSCKMGFSSVDDAIEYVSASLGGNNENTARQYDGKTTLQILRNYNHVITNYPQEVARIMKSIDDTDSIS